MNPTDMLAALCYAMLLQRQPESSTVNATSGGRSAAEAVGAHQQGCSASTEGADTRGNERVSQEDLVEAHAVLVYAAAIYTSTFPAPLYKSIANTAAVRPGHGVFAVKDWTDEQWMQVCNVYTCRINKEKNNPGSKYDHRGSCRG